MRIREPDHEQSLVPVLFLLPLINWDFHFTRESSLSGLLIKVHRPQIIKSTHFFGTHLFCVRVLFMTSALFLRVPFLYWL